MPINGPETVTEAAEQMLRLFSAEAYPHLREFSTEHVLQPGYDLGDEFEFGLSLILDVLTTSMTANGRDTPTAPPSRG